MINPFDDLVSKSYAYNAQVLKDSVNWALLRKLYMDNFVNNSKKGQKIPKIIHQIWLGGELPAKYKVYCNSWKIKHPDWQYKLWTDDDVKNIFITRKNLYDSATNLGMKSDILRYEILKQYGGLYVDTDFECIKNIEYLSYLDLYAGVGYDTHPQLYIGLIASVPNHPIIQNAINACGPIYTGNKGSHIMNITGANVFTDAFIDHAKDHANGIVAFPTPYFYPYPNNVRGIGNPYSFVVAQTYAIHHWAVSWIKKR